MGVVLELPKKRKLVKKTSGDQGFPRGIADPHLRAALLALAENDQHLAKVAKLNLMEVINRLDTLEAIVFAQSVLIAELRGKPLTSEQRAKISGVLRRKGKDAIDLA
jgi:hypothetical protein